MERHHISYIRYIGQWLRICVNIVLHEVENAVNLMAPDCSSWGIPCRGTSGRTFFNYQGFVQYGFVDVGNRMISRSLSCRILYYRSFWGICSKIQSMTNSDQFLDLRLVAICLIILAKRSIFIIENPGSSLLFKHFRFEWLTNIVSRVLCLNYGLGNVF